MTTGSDSGDLNLEGSAPSTDAEPGQDASSFHLKLDIMGVEETAARAPDGTPAAAPPPPSAPVPTSAPTQKPAPVRTAARAQAKEASDAAAGEELSAATVHAVFIALDKAVRARRLYQSNNPVYVGFVNTLKEALINIWDFTNSLSVSVEESGFVWEEKFFKIGEGREALPFQFYKDGIRYLTFLPTFEDEVERFLDVVYRARALEQNGNDDMVTILWEREFAAFQYSFVDALSEGLDVPTDLPVRSMDLIDISKVSMDLNTPVGGEERPYAVQQGGTTVAASISRDDFEETLYFLDATELEILRAEVEKEWQRDLKADVLNALFDRLEDQVPTRQTEILRILRMLMPALLARGDLRSASTMLVELNTFLEAGELLLPAEQQTLARELFAELNEPAVLTQLLRSLQEGAIDPTGAELGVFLRHLDSPALALLIRATETTTVPALQQRLRTAVEQLGRAHPQKLVELVRAEDDVIALGAVRIVGQMALTSAAPVVAALMTRANANVRKAAVEALVAIKSGAALDALQNALEDGDRDVRVAAARGLSNLRYQPARARLETMLQAARLRDADLTEKIAFFEAFGAVANQDSVAMLDRLLNGKNMLRQKQSPEIRACAAMALGKVGTPAARAALEKAISETNPMVRNAVAKAMRRDVTA